MTHHTIPSPVRALLAAAAIATAAVLQACAPVPASSARAACADYPSQAAAQAAADTADPDGDGRYCETLPCPCAGDHGTSAPPPSAPASSPSTPRACTRPEGVQDITFSSTKYPEIRAHTQAAIAAGWPSVLVLNRPGATARRARLLARIPTREGMDRDEYPPAVGRGRGPGLERGTNPRGWRADVQYVPDSQNRSHGSVLGIKLRRFCDGTRFRYVFY